MRLASERPTSLSDILDPFLDAVDRDAWVLVLLRPILGPEARIADYPTFLPKQLAVGLEKAFLDLSARTEEIGSVDPRQALNLIVFEDFFSPKRVSLVPSPALPP
jgi:hypothetical protein